MKEVVIPIFNDIYKVIVCWGNSKYVKKVLSDWHYPADFTGEVFDNRRGICFHHPLRHPVIALPKRPQSPQEIGSLSHEAFHAVSFIFSQIGESNAEEVFAHCIGAVVRITLEAK